MHFKKTQEIKQLRKGQGIKMEDHYFVAELFQLLLAAFTAAFTENMVFSRAIGTNTMLVAAKSKRIFSGLCLGVMYMTTVGALISGIIDIALVGDSAMQAFIPLVYTAAISVIYVLTLLLSMLLLGKSFAAMKKYIHISAFNAAVMGTMYLSTVSCSGIAEYFMFGIGSGAGFCLAALMLSPVYGRLCSDDTPAAFRGFPSVMIFFGILSMAFYGIAGHVPYYGKL